MKTNVIKSILKTLSKNDREFVIKEICMAIEDVASDNYLNSSREGRDENLTSLFKKIADLA